MSMENIAIILAVLLVLTGAGLYIRREKKKGKKCVGCSDANGCGGCCPGTKS